MNKPEVLRSMKVRRYTESEHQAVWSLLPWYVNESLDDREENRVMAHLIACRECQAERDRLQQVARLLTEDPMPVPDHRFAFNKLMRRIGEAERNRDSVAGMDRTGRRYTWLSMWGVAAALVVGIASTMFVRQAEPDTSELFRTLTTASDSTGPYRRIALEFVQPIPALTLRQTLIETRSNIVSGPDALGVYIVEIPLAPGLRDEELIETLRKIEGVNDATLVR